MANGYFRKKVGFTTVQNYITRDRSITLKAKGLYLLIQSFITMPDKTWLKSDFTKMTCEGKKAFDSAWNELKEKGYLKVHICSRNHTWIQEYELLEEPQEGAHTFYYNAVGEVVSTNIERSQKRMRQAESDSQAEDKKENQTYVSENIEIDEKEENPKKETENSTEKEKKRRYTQKGDIVTEDRRYTPFGDIVNGGIENGDPHKGGNNNNNYIINTYDYNDYSINPSVNRDEKRGSDGRIDGEAPVIIDLSRALRLEESAYAKNLLETEGEIPYALSADKEKMKIVIQYLCGWNDYALMDFQDYLSENAYVLVVKGIIEMATARDIKVYNTSSVSYKHVIDQLNIILQDTDLSSGRLSFFVERALERFVKALKEKEIRNPEQYVKSVIWSNFTSYKIDWDGYFHRSYYNQ